MKTLQTITGKRLKTGQRRDLRWNHDGPLINVRKKVRSFEVYLECGHQQNVPFGRRPQVGKRMQCETCLDACFTPAPKVHVCTYCGVVGDDLTLDMDGRCESGSAHRWTVSS